MPRFLPDGWLPAALWMLIIGAAFGVLFLCALIGWALTL